MKTVGFVFSSRSQSYIYQSSVAAALRVAQAESVRSRWGFLKRNGGAGRHPVPGEGQQAAQQTEWETSPQT